LFAPATCETLPTRMRLHAQLKRLKKSKKE
jgi:hypothetical protein